MSSLTPQDNLAAGSHSEILLEALREPDSSRAYWLDRKLHEIFPNCAVIRSDGFDVLEYAKEHGFEVKIHPGVHGEIATNFYPKWGIHLGDKQTWRTVPWKGQVLHLFNLGWQEGYCNKRLTWIVANSRDIAEEFLSTVVSWNSEVRGEILVFQGGQWGKSKALFDSIQTASFDNLILPSRLKDEIKIDFGTFFASQDQYEKFGVPWKRGVLFYGPPGNGKTHTLKALINWLHVPCLYVRSFKGNRLTTEHELIQQVFERARTHTPCLLVLEDLDSLINDGNRAFFLNELDGFAANTGIVILATTNHPDRIDPAILNRPSRFDRKYEFELPDFQERAAYLELWSARSEPALRLSKAELDVITERTTEFSFAYLKELWLSSMVRWMETQTPGEMASTMLSQVSVLREQMSQSISEPAPDLDQSSKTSRIDLSARLQRDAISHPVTSPSLGER